MLPPKASDLENILKEFNEYVKKPEIFFEATDSLSNGIKQLLKHIYDISKKYDDQKQSTDSALDELIIEGFEEEQIWQQVDLQNQSITDELVRKVARILAKKDGLLLIENTNSDNEILNSSIEESEEGTDKEEDEDLFDDNNEMSNLVKKVKKKSPIDDDFFNLAEMESFCDKMEKVDESEPKEDYIDLFMEEVEEDDEIDRKVRYKDFFGSKTIKKAVRFDEPENWLNEDDTEEEEEHDDDHSDRKTMDQEKGPASTFETRQERLKTRIQKLEEEALEEKPWHLKGEVSSADRPQNSLLEEYVEFDIAARPAPIFTEKTTMILEDVIKQRIKDKAWDDVERKIKPIEDVKEFKKKLILNQEKSKQSLSEIYEEAYLKQKETNTKAGSIIDNAIEKEPEEHTEINNLLKDLFIKLDGLSNFHYTPKTVTPEVKIVSNLPAIVMEEVAPMTTSAATLLAPEEIKNKTKGDVIGRSERTETDKKRERRAKKLKQRIKEREKQKKEKIIQKLNPGMGNKYSKEEARKQLDKLSKGGNVEKMVQSQSKHLKSSQSFFSKLDDNVKSQIKKKNLEKSGKRKNIHEKLSIKKIKL